MARTQVSVDLLKQFAELLSEKCENFRQIKGRMDETLQSFLWDDPVAHKFKADYEEQFQPLKEKLFPAMEKYESYLKDLAGLSDVYTENSSPSLSAFKTAAMAAGVVGVAGAGAAAAGIGITGNEAAFNKNTANGSPSPSASKAAAGKAGVAGVAGVAGAGIAGNKAPFNKNTANGNPSSSASKAAAGKTGGATTRVSFNQDAAIKKLQDQAESKPVGRCAEYVRTAMQEGGIIVGEKENRGSAKNYMDILPKKGYESVPVTLSKDKMNPNMEFKKGDIIVFDECTLPTKKSIKDAEGKIIGYEKVPVDIKHEHGHIQMFDGEQWVSDYKQKSFWPWGAEYTPENIPKYTVFRLKS
jgi:hypothetical protein